MNEDQVRVALERGGVATTPELVAIAMSLIGDGWDLNSVVAHLSQSPEIVERTNEQASTPPAQPVDEAEVTTPSVGDPLALIAEKVSNDTVPLTNEDFRALYEASLDTTNPGRAQQANAIISSFTDAMDEAYLAFQSSGGAMGIAEGIARQEDLRQMRSYLLWMFQPDKGGLVGASINDIDFQQIYEVAIDMFPELEGNLTTGQQEGESDEDFRERKVIELLIQENDISRSVVQAYGDLNGMWQPYTLVEGIPLGQVRAIQERGGWSYSTAVRAALSGKRHGLDVDLAARVLGVGTQRGLNGSEDPAVVQRGSVDLRGSAGSGQRGRSDRGPVRPGDPAALYGSRQGGTPPRTGMGADRYEGALQRGDIQPVPGYGVGGENLAGSNVVLSRFSGYMSRYSEQPLVAAVATYIEPFLAEKMYNSPQDLTGREIQEIMKLAEQLGLDTPGMEYQYNWLNNLKMSSAVVQIDEAGIREAARTLAGAWNMAGVSDQFLDNLVGEFGAKARAAYRQQMGNPFNPDAYDPGGGVEIVDSPSSAGATVAERLRGTAEYKQLFGRMQAGQTEEEYAGQFDSRSMGLLGSEDMTAIRAGMRSGDVNTVARNAMATGTAYDSSTFMGRLYQLRDAFKRTT